MAYLVSILLTPVSVDNIELNASKLVFSSSFIVFVNFGLFFMIEKNLK